jgi:uncharacterized protein YuzE
VTSKNREERGNAVGKEVKVWYDQEADYLEVLFERKEGYFRETENDAVMEKVDTDGNILGFSILRVSALERGKPLSVTLNPTTTFTVASQMTLI